MPTVTKFLLMSVFLTACGGTDTDSELMVDIPADVAPKVEEVAWHVDAIAETVKTFADRDRLVVLNRSVKEADNLIKTKGFQYIPTTPTVQKMVRLFKDSEDFFRFIKKDVNAELIDSLLFLPIENHPESIKSKIGYDKAPLGTILAEHVEIIAVAVQGLLAADELPSDVRKGLEALMKEFRPVLGPARGQGDRPVPYSHGREFCPKVEKIYPLLDRLDGSQQFFSHSQSIRGANEFLKDFLQVNQKVK